MAVKVILPHLFSILSHLKIQPLFKIMAGNVKYVW